MGRSLKRKEKAQTPEELKWAQDHEKEVRAVTNAIARVVNAAIGDGSVTDFAKKIQYSRQVLSTLLHQDDVKKQRPWTLDTLIAVADAVGCSLSELIGYAEAVKDKSGETPALFLTLRLCGTKPCSDDRLSRIIQAAGGEEASDEYKELWLNADMLKALAPEAYLRYTSGGLSDAAVYTVLRRAVEEGKGGKSFYMCLE